MDRRFFFFFFACLLLRLFKCSRWRKGTQKEKTVQVPRLLWLALIPLNLKIFMSLIMQGANAS